MTFMSKDGSGLAGLKGYNKLGGIGKQMNMTCITLQKVFDDRNIKHVDYISLDIEGSELEALKSIDFSKTAIDIFTIEMNNPQVNKFMKTHGYIHKMQLHEDGVFIHETATQKLQWIDAYLAQSNFATYNATIYHNIVAIPKY
eukprot:157646_1